VQAACLAGCETMTISKQNSKNLLFATLLFFAVLLQNCKKDAAGTTAAPPKQGMYALVNDTAWTASTVTASLEYNGFNTGKTFTCQGTMGNKIIQLIASQNNVAAGNDFPLGPANANSASFGYLYYPYTAILPNKMSPRALQLAPAW
jgi:hypothetical protein